MRAVGNGKALLRSIKKSGGVLLLDFDGVLSPIVQHPSDAQISPQAHDAIRRLSKRMPVAVVSGRALADVRRRVGVRGIVYAGSHGTEWTVHGRTYRKHPTKAARAAFQEVGRALVALTEQFEGVVIDRKHHSISFNYRGVPRTKVPTFRREVFQILARARNGKALRVMDHLSTIDISASPEWTKGECAMLLYKQMARRGMVPIFIGDSLTDEDAFAALGRGITIRVGKWKGSKAQYYFSTRTQVDTFLAALADSLEAKA